MLLSAIAEAERQLLLRVLRYSPSGELSRMLGTILIDARVRATDAPLRWIDIPPAAAQQLWAEVLWFRGLFTADEKELLDRIEAHLAEVKAQADSPVTTASS
jgi:ubiquinone biosynthesis protein UbiJ